MINTAAGNIKCCHYNINSNYLYDHMYISCHTTFSDVTCYLYILQYWFKKIYFNKVVILNVFILVIMVLVLFYCSDV